MSLKRSILSIFVIMECAIHPVYEHPSHKSCSSPTFELSVMCCRCERVISELQVPYYIKHLSLFWHERCRFLAVVQLNNNELDID